MLKVGSQFRVEAPKFTSQNAIIVASAFDIHGLQLSAVQPIPSTTIAFLKSKGAEIQVIEEDGDKLIRMTGNINLSREDVVGFLGYPYQPSYEEQYALRNNSKSIIITGSKAISLLFNGLSLIARKGIPQDVMAFLESKGAQIKICEDQNGAKYFDITTLKLTRDEVTAFLKTRAASNNKTAADKPVEGSGTAVKTAVAAVTVAAKTAADNTAANANATVASAAAGATVTSATAKDVKDSSDKPAQAPGTQTAGTATAGSAGSDAKMAHEVCPARHFPRQVLARIATQQHHYDLSMNDKPLGFTFAFKMGDQTVASSTPVKKLYPDGFTFNIINDVNFSGAIIHALKYLDVISGKNILVKGGTIISDQIGLLAEVAVHGHVKFHSELNTKLVNALVQVSGDFEVISEEDEVNLAYEPNKVWFNKPSIPSLVFSDFQPLEPLPTANTNTAVASTPSPVASNK